MNYEPKIDHASIRAHRQNGLRGKQKAFENGVFKKPIYRARQGESFENPDHKPTPDRKLKITEADMVEIRKLFDNGMTMRDIGKKYKVSGTTIANRLKKKQNENI